MCTHALGSLPELPVNRITRLLVVCVVPSLVYLKGCRYEAAIRGIVAVRGYIYPLFIFIWVELYLTLYLNTPYKSGLVHRVTISSIKLSTNSYTF